MDRGFPKTMSYLLVDEKSTLLLIHKLKTTAYNTLYYLLKV